MRYAAAMVNTRMLRFGVIVLGLFAAAAHAQTVPTGFSDLPVVSGLGNPVAFDFVPDAPGHVRFVIAQQFDARVRLVRDGAVLADVMTVPGISPGGEKGLLGIAIDPGFPARPYLYVHCDDASGNTIRISRFTVTGDLLGVGNGALSADPNSRYDLIDDVPDNAGNHNGGTVRFGPDAKLYASFGEDADPCGAQDRTTLKGVILRLDVSRLPAGPGSAPRALVAPDDNPFAADPDSNARLVFAYGLRNPFRFQFDDARGWLVIADVGQNEIEELDLLKALGGSSAPGAASAGANFGWPWFEGNNAYSACSGSATGLSAPIATYGHDSQGGVVIISAGAYHPSSNPLADWPSEYNGDLFFSDYGSGFLRRLKQGTSSWAIAPAVAGQPTGSNWGSGYGSVSDFRFGPEGSLWYVRNTSNGALRRIVYDQGEPPPPPPPTFAVRKFSSHPQPAVGSVTLDLDMTADASVDLHVFDARGRRVRTLRSSAALGAGPQDVLWDGLDDQGESVPAGQYFVRLRVKGIERRHAVTLLR